MKNLKTASLGSNFADFYEKKIVLLDMSTNYKCD